VSLRVTALRLPKPPERSEDLEWQLVGTLFNQTQTLVIGGVGLFLVALFGWWDTHQPWFLWWAIAVPAVLVARLLLERAYWRRREGAGRVALWRRRFIAGAWLMGGMWGCGALVIARDVPPLLQMIVLATLLVIVMGGAARNAGCPMAATGQTLLGLVPAFVVCATRHDRYHLMFCAVVLFVGFAAFSLMHQIYERLVRLMLLNEENLALVDRIRRANIELSVAATTDSLTGIANRRCFDAVLLDEASRAERSGGGLSVFLLDVDSFKEYNDNYGHPAGDQCLLLVAKAFAATLRRPADFVARYGGEEFVAVLPQTSVVAAAALAEVVRKRIQEMTIVHSAAAAGVVTVSIGVAGYSGSRSEPPAELLRAADVALYAAKSAGRNCVRIAPENRSLHEVA
jgi:diguanylate cyclase (GGDEF)-like protein